MRANDIIKIILAVGVVVLVGMDRFGPEALLSIVALLMERPRLHGEDEDEAL